MDSMTHNQQPMLIDYLAEEDRSSLTLRKPHIVQSHHSMVGGSGGTGHISLSPTDAHSMSYHTTRTSTDRYQLFSPLAAPSKAVGLEDHSMSSFLATTNNDLSKSQSQFSSAHKPMPELFSPWVTVFGFPPSSVSQIIDYFSTYGTIIKHVYECETNWIHLCFENERIANRVLHQNGQTVRGAFMIGVKPCDCKEVLEGRLPASSSVTNPTKGITLNLTNNNNRNMNNSAALPLDDRTNDLESMGFDSANPLSPIRPLSSAYYEAKLKQPVSRAPPPRMMSDSNAEELSRHFQQPQDPSYLSRAWNYLTAWR